ncbi:hypothetical protein OsI_22955 [Oryza sativa Indica Group]|uniref:Uncharacterized protein n=2 Tax=Oryza sativa TaxID=4530 RepID=Q8S5Z9_ORYSJ|nr:hypothetical protein [Oryza sativa Japonica Group]EAZ00925.1 hypothetical protein OsI_22955 [Oryza sativa Indica Group]
MGCVRRFAAPAEVKLAAGAVGVRRDGGDGPIEEPGALEGAAGADDVLVVLDGAVGVAGEVASDEP